MHSDTLQTFKALADEIRLRILRCISVSELSVAELVTVLGLPQSTVSRHLKPLRDAELVEARRNGTSVYYRRGRAFSDGDFSSLMDTRLSSLPAADQDRASVRRVLDHRKKISRAFFDEIAGSYGSLTEPGGGWRGVAAALAVGLSGKEVADLGAGEGQLALLLARFASRVIAVDQSPRMLRLVEEAAEAAGLDQVIQVAEGDLEALPLPEASVDVCFMSQSLHHAADPGNAVADAARVLRKGGTLIVLDLISHEQEWVKEQYADQWLGFEVSAVEYWMTQAGLSIRTAERLSGATPDLPVLLMVGEK
ncbi:MAG: ubiquinone/menaquinone biosynthesis C-methylase UbiE [Kiritimatiellia bacterium]|jgi:ubiquinone/menaquinone biosynthesis C-methylase UbiE